MALERDWRGRAPNRRAGRRDGGFIVDVDGVDRVLVCVDRVIG